jgi:small-conductance mechanosensitive channel
MDVQQEINIAIYEKLLADGVSFAFPTRTVHGGEVNQSASATFRQWFLAALYLSIF